MKKCFILLLALCLVLFSACHSGSRLPEETTAVLEEGYYVLIPVEEQSFENVISGDTRFSQAAVVAKLELTGGSYHFIQTIPGSACSEEVSTEPGSTYLGKASPSENRTLKYYKNDSGYYFIETVTKTRSCYANDGKLLWEMTIRASFRFVQQSVSCTDVSGEVRIGDTESWYVISEETAAEGTSASYTVDFGREMLGVTTSSSSYTIHVTCDEQGNLS